MPGRFFVYLIWRETDGIVSRISNPEGVAMRLILGTIGLLLIICLPVSPAYSQGGSQGGGATSELDAESLVREWFARLNALDDWSPENVENREQPEAEAEAEQQEPEETEPEPGPPRPSTESLVEAFVELYRPDAFLFVKPNEHQLGPVMYSEQAGVRTWADYYASSFFDLAYRIDMQTASEVTANLFYSTPLPWGGLAVSVEFTAIYTFRDGEKKFWAPGAAFFQFAEDGKIQRLRLFELADETFEVIP